LPIESQPKQLHCHRSSEVEQGFCKPIQGKIASSCMIRDSNESLVFIGFIPILVILVSLINLGYFDLKLAKIWQKAEWVNIVL
jgi:hypothetical protein